MSKFLHSLKAVGGLVVLIAAFTAVYSYAMFQGGFVSWFLFYSFLPSLLYAFLIVVYPLELFKVERIIEQSIYETGDPLVVEIKITRRFPIPIYYLLIEDDLPSTIKSGHYKEMIFPWFKRNYCKTYTIESLPRGEHYFKGLRLVTSDFFGFIKKERLIVAENRIIVYPKMTAVDIPAILNQNEDGKVAKGFARTESMIPSSVREYQPGDRYSWINWKMTARKNTPMTKEFERYEEQQVVVLMDRNVAMTEQTFEDIVHYTASLLNTFYQKSIPAGLISVGDEAIAFPVRRSVEMSQQIFYHLATVRNDSNLPFISALEPEISQLPSKGTLMFITETMTTDLEYLLKRLALRPYKLVVILSTPDHQLNRHQFMGGRVTVVSGLEYTEPTEVKTG